MITISIANCKGGVGKTIVAANLAWELARLGYLTLMVDLDPQCDLSKVYRRESQDGPNIFRLLRGECAVEEACLEVADNLYLVAGSRDTIHFDDKNGEKVLANCLKDETLAEVDFVIIDHPPTLSEYTLAGFVASDAVLIVTDTESFSMRNLGHLFENLLGIKATMHPTLSILGIVANKVDQRRKLTGIMLQELERTFGECVFSSRISYDTAIPISIRRGQPLRRLDWRSRTIGQFQELTHEVLERVGICHGNV